MTIKTKPKTKTKPGLVVKKIGTLTKPMVHHIGNTITP